MEKKIRTIGYIGKRALTLLLICALLLTLLPPISLRAAAAQEEDYQFVSPKENEEDAALNRMTVYKWHRIHNQSDLEKMPKGEKVPVLILWKTDDGRYLFVNDDGGSHTSSGGEPMKAHDEDAVKGKELPPSAYTPDPFDPSSENDMFFSTDVLSNVTMKRTGGKDSDNKDCWEFRIWFGSDIITGWDDWDWDGAVDSAEDDIWTVYTKEVGGKYAGGLTDAYPLRIFANVKYDDTGFMHDGDYAYGYCDDTYDYSPFAMYWAEKVWVSAITDNYTIGEGMVMNIDNGVILKEGVTLTVMPGGVLSIEGQFYNNGVIENHGTVILQPDSCITSFAPTSKNAGAIINTGAMCDTQADKTRMIREKNALITALDKRISETETEIRNQQTAHDNAVKKIDQLLAEVVDPKVGESRERVIERLQNTADYYRAELADMEAKATTEDEIERVRSYAEKTVTPAIEAYNTAYAPIREQENIAGRALERVAAAQEELESYRSEKSRMQKQIEQLEAATSGSETRGEGNLLVMKNARLVFNNTSESVLSILDGGSCVCNGYIISPQAITLSNAKLHVRNDGAVITEHTLSSNILNAKSLNPINPGTLQVRFSGMTECGSSAMHSIWASGNYVIRVDGVFRYLDSPVYDASRGKNVGISRGTGVWSTEGAPRRYTDADGSSVTIDDNGNKTVVKPDGTTIYTDARTGTVTEIRPDGVVITTLKDGTSTEKWPNGSYIKRFANGSVSEAVIYRDDSVTEYDSKLKMYLTTFTPAKKDGLTYICEYSDGRSEDWYYNSRRKVTKRIMYNAESTHIYEMEDLSARTELYTFTPSSYTKRTKPETAFKEGDSGTYVYSDHTTYIDADGWANTEYNGGSAAGAKIEEIFDLEPDTTPYCILWRVTTPSGDVTTCRIFSQNEVDERNYHYSVYGYGLFFEDGRTCYIDTWDEEPDSRWFITTSSLDAAPVGFTYTKEPLIWAMNEYGSKKVTMRDSTNKSHTYYCLPLTDGTTGYYESLASGIDPGDRRLMRVEYENGAVLEYGTAYYSLVVHRATNALLWRLITDNGTIYCTCAQGTTNKQQLEFPDGTVKGFAEDTPPNPKDYINYKG